MSPRETLVFAVVLQRLARLPDAAAGRAEVTNDANSVVTDPSIDIVIELIGGYTVARELVMAAIEAGKHVVTANKALLATHGNEIFAAARAKGVIVAFEAAVAGGIPIIQTLQEGLVGNRIQSIHRIINGTCNYILSRMTKEGKAFAEVLAEAQAAGLAEADPSFDVDGIDTAHKAETFSLIRSTFGIPAREDLRLSQYPTLGTLVKFVLDNRPVSPAA